MQRVAFYELVSKAFFDPRERVANWARELVSQSPCDSHADPTTSGSQSLITPTGSDPQNRCESIDARSSSLVIDGTYRQINQFGNSWHFKGPWFSLSAILPDQHFTHASAAITFNRPDMQGVTLTVDHKWLLQRFLFGKGAPLTTQHRGYIVGTMPENSNEYLVDLPHCRLFLQEDGVQEIAGVADLLTDVMRNSLNALEIAWSATDFPFVIWGSKKVALAAINVNVWHEIGRFAEEHDVSNGATPWHMFDGNRQVLKPYHETANEHFDAGYHGVIYATEIDGLSHSREVVLLWQPNGLQPGQKFSTRGWWSCEFAFQWLKETLLPKVKRSVYERNFGKNWKRFFHSRRANAFAARLDELFVARDLRQHPLIRGDKWSIGIVESAQVLQRFFHTVGTPEPYFRQSEVENLYRAVAVIAQGRRGYVGYAGSKLGLHHSPIDHADLIRMIHEHIHEGQVVANSAVVDNVFRAMLEMLDDSDAWLTDSDQAMIRDTIAPFARLSDDATLVDRHTKWT